MAVSLCCVCSPILSHFHHPLQSARENMSVWFHSSQRGRREKKMVKGLLYVIVGCMFEEAYF